MVSSSLTFYLYSVFIPKHKILDELNQCYITPIRKLFRVWLGAWGWFPFAEWVTGKSFFAAPWRVHFLWHFIRFWIFPWQSLRIELIIKAENWFTKTKLTFRCPRRRVSFSLELAIYNGIPFLFKQISSNYLDEYLGRGLILGWWLLHGVADFWMLSAVLSGVSFLGAAQCFYILLYQTIIMICFRLCSESVSCFWKWKLLFRHFDHYFRLLFFKKTAILTN